MCVCVCVGCTVEAALEAASLHPANLLGISHRKGTLEYGSDAGRNASFGAYLQKKKIYFFFYIVIIKGRIH